ncbi:MAG: KUP/HAK/KT family potassium transporter [Paucibacter sp.]|nr:KUP/HAK/KT family potassium transporter [Roseateles sp.]
MSTETDRLQAPDAIVPSASAGGPERHDGGKAGLAALMLAALGVVYGDLGTSPLYAMQAAFTGSDAVAVSPQNVVGLVSLFLWSLILMVSIKYVAVLMRADNHGEGGLLALLALLIGEHRRSRGSPRARRWIYLALIGTAMLYGDGLITPAISVLSAIEGLEVATPAFHAYVVPLTLVILVALFSVQSRGSGKVGVVFGPFMVVWFVVILVLGLVQVVQAPAILAALNPLNGLRYFEQNGWRGFVSLGSVVLCLTGGEALYADMGHFGARPIRMAWYRLALPALALSYMGQGALLLRDASLAGRPFYSMVPNWGLYPMVALSTVATVIASQALITAVFSLTRQAAQLGLAPRFSVRHTSDSEIGQVYLPALNWMLAVGTMGIVVLFGSSDRLASAFGLAVSTTMTITTLLFAALAQKRWGWSRARVAVVAGTFLVVDCSFLGANAMKFMDGGWLPLSIGLLVCLVTVAWFTGQRVLRHSRDDLGLTLHDFIAGLEASPPLRVHGTAVFLTPPHVDLPQVLLHQLKHNQVLHEQVVILSLLTEDAPRVDAAQRLIVEALPLNFRRITVRYGYMDEVDVPGALAQAGDELGTCLFDPMTTSFYLGRETLTVAREGSLAMRLLLRLFVLLHKNEQDMTAQYRIPPNRVVELGARLDLIESPRR